MQENAYLQEARDREGDMAEIDYRTKYVYLDFFHPGSAWERIQENRVEGYLDSYEWVDCFTSIQRYKNAIKEEIEDDISPLFFDFDHEVLDTSRIEACKVLNWLVLTFDLDQEEANLYFSGKKGFHLEIPYNTILLKPWDKNHLAYKKVAEYLIGTLKLNTLDLKIYSRRRVMRHPNTIHSGSGLHKTQLSFHEISSLTAEEIRNMAKTKRAWGLL